ncbi:MAG: hypothetical protein A3C43_06735 [Candidatus Schekmanbacteria bacterium RIFCSPHIGHO2_02_FULL_38_11]|uniref:Murein biosynthesis integral membrane protein MurJ n=1 Tax=Candidatus Schekmanbacteria bacterium RIFCSPLOWO2_12_FULL_38_15 TaxID=1817883 RepID=A0A1F7SME4_9BACT|nr:MAG: hypothetical protein A2043_08325 [Candidatus Schekmanbacteria bacterium GWA2_38_9]OGL48456.1 MAG: hypothetical protein A3H37_07480 [Candidatus Schekmanbacteria bacterium RIFCSPLOWO2_02_FULL_38_14]OGL50184.1 MAG: hypothetical protein A3C43_06735 [Candidatus Schekmanbacteria bacterium RIFCSPHIGHO2_02_FULL_38_11]OGL54943.1 MAG: hypothetical protein A3G31_02360 [Candidatus Schekmanbacteria bacterium RIFCSPLOWO2_12_FULL_38_15]
MTIEKLNLDTSKKVVRNTWVASVGSFFASLFGLLCYFCIALFFGAAKETDAFFAANVLFVFFATFLSTLRYSVVPLMADIENKERFFAVFNKIAVSVLSIVIGFSVSVLLLSSYISSFLGVGFDSQTLAKTSYFIKIIAFSGFFQGIGFLCASALGAIGNFSIPAYSYAFGNFLWLCLIFTFRNLLGIDSVAIGMLVSSFFSCLFQLIYLLKIGYKPRFFKNDSEFTFLDIFKTTILGSGIYVTGNLNYAIGQSLSSYFPEGSATLFAYAATGAGFLVSVISNPISLVILSSLSRMKEDKTRFSKTLSLGIRYNIIFIIPLILFLSVFRTPILRLFLSSSLNNKDIEILGNLILGYIILILVYSLNLILFSAFYAVGKEGTLFLIGLFSILVNLFSSFFLKNYFGLTGLAVAQSVYTVFIFIVLLFKLTAHLEKDIFVKYLKGIEWISLFAVLSTVIVYFISQKYFDLNLFLPLFSTMLLSIGLYLILIFIFQRHELKFFLSTFTNREG